MIKNRILMALGIVTALMPFTGFPNSWTDIFVVILGLAISIMSFVIIREGVKKTGVSSEVERETQVYVENRNIGDVNQGVIIENLQQ